MALKTTLVYPGIAGRGFNSLKQGMDSGWISHGLACLSAAAKAQGFESDLIDLRALSGWDQFRRLLAERDPDVVGVTMMSVDYNPARQAIAIAKQVKPEVVTVIGGPHVTIALEDSLRIPHVDYLVTGEGELTFPRLLCSIEGGDPPPYRYRCGVLLDMMGDKDLRLYQESFSMSWDDTRPLVREIWATADRLGVREFVPRRGQWVKDDHFPLHEIGGIACCNVIDFEYPPWHTQNDVPEMCSALSLAKVGWVIREWLREQ